MTPRSECVAGLAGVRVLVVEDEPLIALELQEILAAGGAEVLGPVPTVQQALATLEKGLPDIAVLDVNLRGERSTPVARALRSASVPFVLSTGYSRHHLDDALLRDTPLIPKPVSSRALLRTLRELLSPG
jgi:two-component system, response regulator PdtaR